MFPPVDGPKFLLSPSNLTAHPDLSTPDDKSVLIMNIVRLTLVVLVPLIVFTLLR